MFCNSVLTKSSILLTLFLISIQLSHSNSLKLNGYATLRGTYADNRNKIPYYYDYADDKFNLTENNNVGLQIKSTINNKLNFDMTLSMTGKDNYKAEAEWAYLSYKINDDFRIRVGRINAPFYMLTDYINIGYTYPWVSPPSEVYSTNPIRAVDGIDLTFQHRGVIDYLLEVYIGSEENTGIIQPNFVDSNANVTNLTKETEIKFFTNNMLGFNFKLGDDAFSVRIGYFQTEVNIAEFNISSAKGNFAGVGLHLDKYNVVIFTELVIRDTEKSLETAFPDQQASYFTLGYRIKDLLLFATSAALDKGPDSSIYALQQTSVAFGFRYEINKNADLKFDVTTIKPKTKLNDIGQYGLFDSPITKESNVYAIALDFLF